MASAGELLESLHLKTLVKEHHAKSVSQVLLSDVDAGAQKNLFATVGHTQATVYDNEHFEKFLAVVVQFQNVQTEYTAGGELTACCWLSTAGQTAEKHGDVQLAVGGNDNCVTVISLAACAAVRLLKGHTQAILDLASVSSRPRLLASASKDGTVRLWDVQTGECTHELAAPGAASVALQEDGRRLFAGCGGGVILEWDLDVDAGADAGPSSGKRSRDAAIDSRRLPSSVDKVAHTQRVDALLSLAGSRLASKSSDGKVIIWSVPTGGEAQQLATWRVVAADKVGRALAATSNGAVLVTGNNCGEVLAYSAEGSLLARLSPGKIRTPVLSCAVASDCRTVLAAYAGGIISRWEVVEQDAAVVDEAAEGD